MTLVWLFNNRRDFVKMISHPFDTQAKQSRKNRFFGNRRDFVKMISHHCDTQAHQSRGSPVFFRLLRLRIAMTARVKTASILEELLLFGIEPYSKPNNKSIFLIIIRLWMTGDCESVLI